MLLKRYFVSNPVRGGGIGYMQKYVFLSFMNKHISLFEGINHKTNTACLLNGFKYEPQIVSLEKQTEVWMSYSSGLVKSKPCEKQIDTFQFNSALPMM